jgi:hypothetical protein
LLRCPVVIGGCGRSGTTFFAAMLGHHRHIQLILYESLALCPDGYREDVADPKPPDLRRRTFSTSDRSSNASPKRA